MISQYIEFITDIYLGLGDTWGIHKRVLPECSYDYYEHVINKLNKFKKNIISDVSDSNINIFANNINQRIFELNVLKQWKNSSMFYVDGIFYTLRDTADLDEDINWCSSLLNSRLENFPIAINNAIRNLNDGEVTKFEIAQSIKYSKMSWNEITEFCKNTGIIIKDSYYNSYRNWISFLENKYALNQNVKFLYPKDVFADYYLLISGIKIDFKCIYEEIETFLKVNKNVYTEYRKQRHRLTHYNIKNSAIHSYIEKIAYDGLNYFDFEPSIMHDLDIINANTYLGSNIVKGSYIRKTNRVNKPIYIFRKDGFYSKNEFLLNLIHEIYPGHHNRQQIVKNKINNPNLELLYDNRFIHEGWAKYCEDFYANVVYNSKNMQSYFISNMYINMTIIYSMLMYILKDFNYRKIFNEIEKMGIFDGNTINNIVLTSFNSGLEKSFYGIGYLSLKNQLCNKNINSLKYEHKHILELMV